MTYRSTWADAVSGCNFRRRIGSALMVVQYHNRCDVVFVRMTGDKTKDVLSSLKKHRYLHQVWNNIHGLNKKLNVNSLPVHTVADKNLW